MSLPWIDIQDFGAVPKPFSFNEPTAPVTLTAGSKVVVIPPGAFLQSLKAGQGVCVPKAGPPTPQANPLVAPNVTCPATSGTATYRYQFVGYDARGGLTAASLVGSVSGAAIGPQRIAIKSVTRDATGKMTIETVTPHNFLAQWNSTNQTLVNIEGCMPFNVNGRFVIFASNITGFNPFPTPTTIVCLTDRASAVTAAVGPASLVSVWGFATVTCPQLSGPTQGYYIYSDSQNSIPNQSLKLIGKCLPGTRQFTDWGEDLAAGYVAPWYVPTAPPTAAQNQLFTTTVTNVSGFALEDPAPTTVSSAMMFDDGVNLLAAMRAAHTGLAGTVWVSPPRVPTPFGGYIFNSPISYPEFLNIEWGCHCIFNETATWTAYNEHDSKFGSPQPMQNAQFSQGNYVDIAGIANPIFSIGEDQGNSGSVAIRKLGFTCYSNGQTAVLIRSAFHCKFKDVAFMAGNPNYGTAVGVVCLGSCSEIEFDGTCWQFSNKFDTTNDFHPGPPLPALWFRSTDNPNVPNGQFTTGMVLFRGQHTFTRRGILFDHLYAANPQTLAVKIGGSLWNQAASTPTIMCWGQQFIGFDVDSVLNDTSQEAIIANWSTFELSSVRLRNCYNNLQPLTTGKPIIDLKVSASSNW